MIRTVLTVAAVGAGGWWLYRKLGGYGMTPHFTLGELTRTGSDLPNVPGPSELTALRALAANVLEPWRALTGPLKVTSGYRSAAVNAAAGGADASQHTKGEAADVKPTSMTSPEAFRLLWENRGRIPVDQAILYAPERGGHVHVSHKPTGRQRGQFLYAPAGTTSYREWTP